LHCIPAAFVVFGKPARCGKERGIFLLVMVLNEYRGISPLFPGIMSTGRYGTRSEQQYQSKRSVLHRAPFRIGHAVLVE
jgi:hypothetical protein